MSSDYDGTSVSYVRKEADYREKALKFYLWICARCAQAFFPFN